MTSVLFVIARTYLNQLKCDYLKNKKLFSQSFLVFLKSTWSFEHLEKEKDEPHSLCISEIMDCEKLGYLNV